MMKNNEVRNIIEKNIDSVYGDLQTLRDNVSPDTQKIINEMLKATQFLQSKCFDLSNCKDVYLG